MAFILITVIAAMPLAPPDPTKPLPPSYWFGPLSADEFKNEFRELVDAAPKNIDEFEAILNHPLSRPGHVSRMYAVFARAKVDHKRFIRSALRDLNHKDAMVRSAAADYAGNVGGGAEFAAPLLMLILHDPNGDVSIAAMTALGKVGDEGTVVALEHLMQFGYGKKDEPERAKAVAAAFGKVRDEIKVRLAAKAKDAPPAKP